MLKKPAGAGVIFPQFIRECVADFYTDMTRKVVKDRSAREQPQINNSSHLS